MRIGIVVNSSWNIYNFRAGLVQAFLRNGHSVVAIAPDDGYAKYLLEWGCEYAPIEMDCKGASPVKDLSLCKNLYHIYKKSHLDVVLHYTIKPNIYGTLAARLARIPSINNVTGLGTVFIRENITSKIAHLLYKFSFRFPQTVFFQNNDDKELFLEKKLVAEDITDILPGSGIDTHYFRPQEHGKNTVFTFLVIARVLYDKGILEYKEAASILKEKGIQAKFQLLGKIDPDKGLGIPAEEVDKWHEEGLIEYLGITDDVRKHICKADCIVLPSYREGTPRTLIEAASMAKPIITTDVPGCRETVKDGYNGYLCRAKSAYDLADKMFKMFKMNEKALKEMGENSRQLAESRFDQNIVIHKYEQAIAATCQLDNMSKPRRKLAPPMRIA